MQTRIKIPSGSFTTTTNLSFCLDCSWCTHTLCHDFKPMIKHAHHYKHTVILITTHMTSLNGKTLKT